MWKWLAILMLLMLILMPALPVLADTTASVTITAVGIVVAAPGGFTLTYVSDYEVKIDWITAPGATNTLVRAAVGRYPTGITDGWLVYYGNLETAIDTGVSLDETATGVYYRAWSEKGGTYSPFWAEGFIEGGGMTLIAFIILALGLTIGGFTTRRAALIVGSAFGWLVLGAYSYSKITAPWESSIYFYLFLMSMAMVIATALESLVIRRPIKEIKEEDTDLKPAPAPEPAPIEGEHPIDKMRRKHGLPPSDARRINKENRERRGTGW